MMSELECIELLLTSIQNPLILETKKYKNIISKPWFKNLRLSLFTKIAINNLVKYYHENTSFSVKRLLLEGRTSTDEREIEVPEIGSEYLAKPNEFIRNLVKALIEENYTFDDELDIFISSEQIETKIPKEWLYIASRKYTEDRKEKIFIYSKLHKNRIANKENVIKYIRQAKSFLCKQTNLHEALGFAKTFNMAKEQTIGVLKNMQSAKVDKIASIFEGFIPAQFDIEIIKYHLPNEIYFVKRAQSYKDFYILPIDKQEQLISEWAMEYFNNNLTSDLITQHFLVSSSEESKKIIASNRNELIVGLFNLYISLITSLSIDFDDISLIKFDLKDYISDEVVNHYHELKTLNKIIAALDKSDYKKKMIEDFNRISQEIIEEQDISLSDKKTELDIIQRKYQENEANIQEYQNRKATLVNLINCKTSYGVTEIAFDNHRIIELIKRVVFSGVVIQNPLDSKKILLETQSGVIGKTTFKSEIKIEDFINLVKTINYYLDERPYKLGIAA